MKKLGKILIFLIISINVYSLGSTSLYYGKLISTEALEEFKKYPEYNSSFIFYYVRDQLSRFLQDCINIECVKNDQLELITKINKLAQFNSESAAIYLANSKGVFFPPLQEAQRQYLKQFNFQLNENLFNSHETSIHRLAVSSTGVGPIILNVDRLKQISMNDAYKILIHEFGHQVGIIDDDERKLDQLSNDIAPYLEQKIQTTKFRNIILTNNYYLFPGTRPSIINPTTGRQEYIDGDIPFEFYPHLFIQDGKHTLALSHLIKRTLLRTKAFPDISTIWIRNPQIKTLDQNTLEIKIQLGQGLNYKVEGKNEQTLLQGELFIHIPINIKNEEINVSVDKNAKMIFKNMTSAFSKVERPTLEKLTFPRTIQTGEELTIEAIIQLPKNKHAKDVKLARLDFGNFSDDLLETSLKLNSKKIENLDSNKIRLFFQVQNDFNSPKRVLKYEQIEISLHDEDVSNFYLKPKFKSETHIMSHLLTTPAKLVSHYIKVYGRNGVTEFNTGDYIELRSLGYDDLLEFNITITPSSTGLSKESFRFVIEEFNGIPFETIQHHYRFDEISNEQKLLFRGNNLNIQFMLIPAKFITLNNSTKFRINAIQFSTVGNEFSTFYFN